MVRQATIAHALMVFLCGWLIFHGNHAAAQTAASDAAVHLVKSVEGNSAPNIAAILAIEDSEKRSAALQRAIEYYEHYLAVHPENVTALQQLGKLYGWTNRNDLAIITYQAAIRIDGADNVLKTDLARIYRWAQRYPEAEVLYKAVLEEEPKNHQALKGLAITYLKLGDYPSAHEIFDHALALYPNDAELYKEQGVLLAWQERYNEAITALKNAIRLSPEMVDAYITLGDVYFWKKQFQQALDEYKKALALDHNNRDLQVMIAKTYRALDNLMLAEEYANNALRLNPVSTDAKALLDEIHKDQHLINWEYGIHYLEFFSMLFVVSLISIGYWRNRRMLHRRHPIVSYTIRIALPCVVLLSSAAFILETQLKTMFDLELYESIASSLAIIMLGIVYLVDIYYAGRTSNSSKDKVVLAIGAHPDDIELGCGGYIFRAKAEGAKVYGLTLTKGERGTGTVNVREKEARNAAHFMGLDDYWILDFADTHLQNNLRELKEKIEEIVKKVSPTMVLIHNPHDHHADHRAAFTATKEAARQVPAIMCYESVSTPEDFKPDCYVDITDYLPEMLRSVGMHKSQAHKSYMDGELLKGRAAHRGIQSGVPYAQAFHVYRIIH